MKFFILPGESKNLSIRFNAFLSAGLLVILTSLPASAHFGAILPSTNLINQENMAAEITLAFFHPFEKSGMNLEQPEQVTLTVNGSNENLNNSISETIFLGSKAWALNFKPKRPGVYWLSMKPTPYWEPAEDLFIIHYTKTALSAFGDDQGWDTPIGLKTEIVPLLRPFGNYAGNTFSGKVLVDNAPVPNAEVEVEHYNTKNLAAPSDLHITQVIKTDENGNFSFTCPFPGWWAFSALTEADFTMKSPDGVDKQVELGAVIWVYFDPIPKAEQ